MNYIVSLLCTQDVLTLQKYNSLLTENKDLISYHYSSPYTYQICIILILLCNNSQFKFFLFEFHLKNH